MRAVCYIDVLIKVRMGASFRSARFVQLYISVSEFYRPISKCKRLFKYKLLLTA